MDGEAKGPELPAEGEALADLLDSALAKLWEGDPAELSGLLGDGGGDGGEGDTWSLVRSRLLSGLAARTPDGDSYPVGTKISDYEILGKLGHGAVGVVYRAKQADPEREVALKLLRAGSQASEEEVLLLAREAQALAQLEHPSIARLYDAELGASGDRYLAMECVDGPSLDRYAIDHDLDLEAQLRLLREVTVAVAYAHRRGVVHLDLKPSNILVDAEGRPRVLDFGLARIREGFSRGSRDPLETIHRTLVGTLAYMAPEQVRGDASQIDTRTDLYALGVVFFQVLTGTLPFDLSPTALVESARVIQEQLPPMLSSRKETIPKDLDAIVSMCLRKEPEGRYRSAQDLVEDLDRFLEGYPVSARKPSLLYRLQKFALRRRRTAALALVAVLAVVLGVAATIKGVIDVRASERQARLEARKADASSRLFTRVLSMAIPELSGRDDLKVRDLLDAAERELEESESIEASVEALVRATIGRAYMSLAQYGRAHEQLSRALAIRRRIYKDPHPELATSLRDMGFLAHCLTSYVDAETLLRQALAMRLELFGEAHPQVTQSRSELSELLHAMSRSKDAVAIARAGVEKLKGEPNVPATLKAIRLAELASNLKRIGAFEESARLARRAWKEAEGQHLPVRQRARVATIVGTALTLVQDREEARRVYTKTIALVEKERGKNDLALPGLLQGLAGLEREEGQFNKALDALERARAVYSARLTPEHPLSLQLGAMICTMLTQFAKPPRVYKAFEALIPQVVASQGPEHIDLAKLRISYAYYLLQQAAYEKASQVLTLAEAVAKKSPIGPAWQWASYDVRAQLVEREDPARALPLYQEMLEYAVKHFAPDSPQVQSSNEHLKAVKAKIKTKR